MKSHELVVRIRDDERLAELEKVIAKGQKTFVDVGLALAEIRASRLYRREYSGFEEYCQKKLGWSASRARQLVASAQVAKSVTIVTLPNKATAWELSKAEPADRAGVIKPLTPKVSTIVDTESQAR